MIGSRRIYNHPINLNKEEEEDKWLKEETFQGLVPSNWYKDNKGPIHLLIEVILHHRQSLTHCPV